MMKRSRIYRQSSPANQVSGTGRRTGAFTLIEVLLAVMLGSTVVTATAVVAVQSVSIQRSVESDLVQRWRQVKIFEQFEADIESEVVWLPEAISTIVFNDEPDQLLEVIGLTWVHNPRSTFGERLPARIMYTLTDLPAEPGQKALVREVRYLTESQSSPHRQILTHGLLEARVEFHVDKEWTARPVIKAGASNRPDAVRLSCRWRSSPDRITVKTVIMRDREHRTGRQSS